MYTPDAEIVWSLRTPRSCRLRKFFECTHPTHMQAAEVFRKFLCVKGE
jgi:hypothetical protein